MSSWFRRRLVEPRVQKRASTNDHAEYLVTIKKPFSADAEAYRTLRTNLLYSTVDGPSKVVVLASPGPGEGKTTICANLSVALAQAGKSTLAVDCDFRNQNLHHYFGLRNSWGLVDVLSGEHILQEVWKEPFEGLKVVPGGSMPPYPAELLSSSRFAEFLAGVRGNSDYVLLDSPPIGKFADPVILATQSDGVLLVVDARNTSKISVRQSVHRLQAVGANVLGTVVNKVERAKEDAYYTRYK